ncbi:MAG: glucose-1-phosphate thymidylyltransferase RfbA [Gammaproteobacteria bacterium]|tara:strand:+ start:147 stop:1019 length:873 start_codon:yes stop_codon:yes gene_type:complete
MTSKGIILAGGRGSRLYPITIGVSKQLLPIFDKPMIFYPLSVLMLAGIRDILIITDEFSQDAYKKILGDGSFFGINLQYAIQKEPNGIAEAFLLAENFISNEQVSLILGDNIFYGQNLTGNLQNASKNSGATVFTYQVSNPEEFGVLQVDDNKKITSIEEKPKYPKTNLAITGLYFYDENVVEIAKSIKPSSRGELEISSVNNKYLEKSALSIEHLGRGYAWLDTGTYNSLIEASQFIEIIQKRQGLKVGCLEEIAFNNSWITSEDVSKQALKYNKTEYGEYLRNLIKAV